MCTLSYLPRKNGYYLVNNRDESPSRAITLQPQTLDINGKTVLCPLDTEGKGTWIGVNDSGRMVCLMNGAFELHVKKPHYRMSRGRVTLELLGADDAVAYFQEMDLQDIEPFTVIIIDEINVVVLRWDEVRKHEEILSRDVPHIWSYATLYEPKVARARKEYFNSHINQFDSHNEILNQWHMNRIEGAPSVLLNLPMVKTVSITTITKTDSEINMKYEDLLHEHMYNYELPFQSELKS